MSFWSKLFGEKESKEMAPNCVKVDMHSHILPNLDDGSESVEESLSLINSMIDLGYEKLIMTPHIMGDFYKNTPETINTKLELLRNTVAKNNINIELDMAAEYYLDESFVYKLKNEKLLTLKDNYVLLETSYMNRPNNFFEVIFDMQTAGYKPVIAHPERYVYLYESFEKFQEVYERGVLFQINLNSLTGYYSGMAKKYAEMLIDHQMVDFIGSDCHAEKHIHTLSKAMKTSYYKKLSNLNLLNNELL